MSDPSGWSFDWEDTDEIPPVGQVFDLPDPDPNELQQTVQQYLSQETRHNILQLILGHPEHLVSITEFAYYLSKSRAAITDQLGDLAAHSIVKQYYHEPNADVRSLPEGFWGLTEFGVLLLTEYNYLRGLPIMRAVHDATQKSARVRRHENAPRPTLPEGVNDRLSYDEPDESEVLNSLDSPLFELREETLYTDAAPDDPAVLNEGADGDRTLDELF